MVGNILNMQVSTIRNVCWDKSIIKFISHIKKNIPIINSRNTKK